MFNKIYFVFRKTQKSFNELAILEYLPHKMRTDVALNVHYTTLRYTHEKIVKMEPFTQ
jgi:hypothetical protein